MVKYNEYLTLFKSQDNFITFYNRNKHIFDLSWYEHKLLTDEEIDYLNLLSTTFNVKSPQGFQVPFIPYSWQIDFHANSLIVKKEKVKNDLIMKGRGISYTYSSIIEAIMAAIVYKGTTVPIMAHRGKSTNKLIQIGFWLINNANYDIRYNKKITSEIQIIHKDGTISYISPFPSGTKQAIESVRSLRPVLAIIDEAGVNPYFSEMLEAVEESIQTEEAKILIGGTPKGTQHKFWKMHKKQLMGYNKYFLPAFKKYPTLENINELKPLVWWYNLTKLRNKLFNGADSFMQEYQCNPFNDKDSLIPKIYHDYAVDNKLIVKAGIRVLGIDVASTGGDFAAATIFKYNKEQFKQENLWYWRNIELPDLEKYIKLIIEKEKPDLIRIDCKGIGLHLFQNLKRQYDNVEGIRGEMKVGIKKDLKQNLKEFMIRNFEQKMKNRIVDLLYDKLQEDHILNVNKNFMLTSKKGHNDVFIACCIATLPLNLQGSLDYDDINRYSTIKEIKDERNEFKLRSVGEEFRDRMMKSGFGRKKQTYNWVS